MRLYIPSPSPVTPYEHARRAADFTMRTAMVGLTGLAALICITAFGAGCACLGEIVRSVF